ncbi:kinase-like domain-containing protein [Cladochytrium replicatum]|nr:kinase-like domain-containing protein [Cladochytrium replicatum]
MSAHFDDQEVLPKEADRKDKGPKRGIQVRTSEIERLVRTSLPAWAEDIDIHYHPEKGFNNLVFAIQPRSPASEGPHSVILKVGGRFWIRRKTENEVAALRFVKESCGDAVPTAAVLAFHSDRATSPITGIEFVLFEKADGIALTEVWDAMERDERIRIVRELGRMMGEMKRDVTKLIVSKVSKPILGSFLIPPTQHHDSFLIDSSIDGDGPWTDYLDWLASMLKSNVHKVRTDPSLPTLLRERMGVHLERIEKLIDTLESGTIDPATEPVFCHNDFAAQNILVKQEGRDSRWVVSSILDFEWASLGIPEHEFLAGHDFLCWDLSDEDRGPRGGWAEELSNVYFGELEARGQNTPRTHRGRWEQRRNVLRLCEAIAPWYLGGIDVPSERDIGRIDEAVAIVTTELEGLGF